MKTMDMLLNHQSQSTISSHYGELARKAEAERSYDPPGEFSKYGKRHDNDFADISNISVIPTKEEVLCDRDPFLPCFLPNAPHFLPNGAARLLDTQFRLLREDMLTPIRGSIQSLIDVLSQGLNNTSNKSNLSKGLKKIRNEYADLHVYNDVEFVDITCSRRNGIEYTLRFTPPKVRGSYYDRKTYWEKSRRLLNGSLITLLLPNPDAKRKKKITTTGGVTSNSSSEKYLIFFGVVVSRNERVLAKHPDYVDLGISFTDPSIYPIALDEISYSYNMIENSIEERFMVESTGVYFEAYNHVLNTIKSTKPSSLPFVKYFAPISDRFHYDVEVKPPLYARAPGFHFDLSVICDRRKPLTLNVENKSSYDEVAKKLNNYCRLDQTQAKALIHALTREIALIEGPPGTGKTVVGVEIMKVLLAKENHNANIGPVLTICFTNHALDQFLEHLLDAKITNIVRLGTRTKSERIEEYTLEEVCKKRSDKHSKEVSRSIAGLHQSLESIEQEIDVVNYNLFKRWMSWQDVQAHLMTNERTFYDKFNHVSNNELPSWVLGANNREEVDFISAQNRWNHLHTFEKWLRCMDYIIIKRRKEALSRSPIKFSYDSTIDYETIRWIIDYEEPETDRPLYMLLYTNSVWQMSRIERRKLHDYWRDKIQEKFIERLSKLKNKHDKKREELNYIYDNERQKTLKDCDVIGMTTNGAAKFQNLIRSIGPKIIVCEEAGEVLEAHILSALSPATQHIILIGDPNQLRPRIATYSLSLESKEGKNYQLDKSLFERLVNGDKAAKIDKVQLLTQRRMRKHEISDLIRYTIYPELIDGENTANYSNIRGSQQNVFFIDHRYPEDDTGGDFATQSHVNKYEVKMVVEMVKHFVRNGYTKPEDIAVITPYLGQMMKIKEALDDSFVVVIDERDAQSLAEMEQDDGKVDKNEKVALEKSLHQQVTLRTVDNFQGEEANIVIISLVRNFAGFGKRDTIGFLKSTNRSNVLLSRAREGMYLIGNSKLMAAKSKNMWTPVINMLQSRNPPQIGFGFPIICNKHPDYKNIIDDPEQFAKVSPDGGCLKKCRIPLPCGHRCTYKCHSDDPEHIGIQCLHPCKRLLPKCNHPCTRLCFENCGNCNVIIGDIMLTDCGHIIKNARCWQKHNKDTVKCLTYVRKQFTICGHSKVVHCYESIDDDVQCESLCGKTLECNHKCLNECFKCQELSKSQNKPPVKRAKHINCKEIYKGLNFCGNVCKFP